MQDLRVMGVVHVCKDAKKLAINSANGCGKGGVEGVICQKIG